MFIRFEQFIHLKYNCYDYLAFIMLRVIRKTI